MVRRQIRRSQFEEDEEEDDQEEVANEEFVIMTDKNGVTDAKNVDNIVMKSNEIFL